MHHQAWGDPGKPALVLIHGMWGGSRHWAGVAPFFPDHHLVAPDLPGFGVSENPARECAPAHFARGVLALMDALGIPHAVLVGNSLGGRVAAEAAFQAPDRVLGLVLVAPAGLSSPAGWLKALPKFRMPYEDGPDNIDPRTFRDLALAQMFSRPLDDPRIAPLAQAEREAHRGISFASFLTGSARCLTEMAKSVPEPARLKALPVRGLVWGRGDRLIPLSVAEEMKALWPSARFELIEDTGHVPHLETPEPFAAALKRALEPARIP